MRAVTCSITTFFFMLFCLSFQGTVSAMDIQALLDAAENHPAVEVSALSVEESSLNQVSALASLYPKIGVFSMAGLYSSPTNLRPMPPTEVDVQAGESIPFSREILRYGLTLEVPVFVKELYTLRQKAALLTDKAVIDKTLDTVGRKAAVVELNSTLAYLERLGEAIEGRRKSLEQTLDDIALKVRNGRLPDSERVKIETGINSLDQQANDLLAKRLDVLQAITSLTRIELGRAVPMSLVSKPAPMPFLQVLAQQKNVDAAGKEVERRHSARWYPTVSLNAYLSGNDGTAYNTDDHIYRSYNAAALVLKLPLYDRSLDAGEAIARIQWQKSKKQLDRIRIDVSSLADSLDRKLPVVERSLELAEQSIANNRSLLEVARVAIHSGRITMEDYLQYESNLLAAQATLCQARQQRWQIIARQAALYGTDFKGVVN